MRDPFILKGIMRNNLLSNVFNTNSYGRCLLRGLRMLELDMLLHQDQRLVKVEGYGHPETVRGVGTGNLDRIHVKDSIIQRSLKIVNTN